MKRLILLLLCAAPLAAQTPNQPMVGVSWKAAGGGTFSPALISSYSTGIDNAYLVSSSTALTAPSLIVQPKLPFLGGNNCALLAFTFNSGYTISSVTDDKSETWTAGPTVSDANFTKMALYYVLADTAGTSKITVAFSGQASASHPYTYMGAWVDELKNCGTTIGGSGTLDTAATGSALTLTLSAAPSLGDMVLGYFWDTNGGPTTQNPLPYNSTITAGSGFTLVSKSLAYGKLSEFNTSTTSTSVPVTFSGTDKILGLGIVVKMGPAGTNAPTTKYIDHFEAEQANTTTPTLYFPCSGNLIVLLYTSNVHAANVSSTTGASATWNTGPLSSTNALVEIPYGTGATCSSSTTISPTLAATPNSSGGTEFDIVSISNAASTFDTSVVATPGTQNVAANLSTVSITPAATNEIIFGLAGITWHTPTGTATDANSHTPVFLAAVNSKADNADPSCAGATPASTLDGDNALAFFQNVSNTTAVTFIWSGTQTTGSCTTNPAGMGGWDAVAAAFK